MLYIISIIGMLFFALAMVYIVNRKNSGRAETEKIGVPAVQTSPLKRGELVLVRKKKGRDVPAIFMGSGYSKKVVQYSGGGIFKRTNVVRA